MKLYVPLLLFHPKNETTNTDQIAKQLKKSFSENLALFYPFAGRLKTTSTSDLIMTAPVEPITLKLELIAHSQVF